MLICTDKTNSKEARKCLQEKTRRENLTTKYISAYLRKEKMTQDSCKMYMYAFD